MPVKPRMSMYEQVKEFHERFGLDINTIPVDMSEVMDNGLWQLRKALVEEEFHEFITAMYRGDIIEIADAICDLHYVLSGTSVSFGISEDECFTEVHRSNMSKANPDGSVNRRKDGKILKSKEWSPPDLVPIIFF